MSDENDLMKEIDAIVQNSGQKKRLDFKVTRHAEIVINKEDSSADAMCGEIAIVNEKKFLDGSVEREDCARHKFTVDNKKQMVIDNYNPKRTIRRQLMKVIKDYILGVMSVAAESKMSFKIDHPDVYDSEKGVLRNQLLVVCETGKNRHVAERIEQMLFEGQANVHVDIGQWQNSRNEEKCKQWAYLEIERILATTKDVVLVSGTFKNWYDFMPLAVIARMHNVDLVLGKTAGQKLSVGEVFDVDKVLEHFLASHILSDFYDDPYSSIEYFKNIDATISSLVIFPSILHNFLAR